MLCAESQNLLSDYLDGELSDAQRVAVDAHLRDCARCATLRNDLARIIHASASLPLHTPSPKVWAAVEREISGRGGVISGPKAWWDRAGARRFDFSVSARQLAAAAAAAVVLAGAFVAFRVASSTAIQPTGMAAAATSGVAAPTGTELANSESREEVARMSGAVADMEKMIAKREPTWSAELRDTYLKNVADLDAKIGECQRDYDARGTSTTCALLIAAYRAKLSALEEFAQVAAPAPQHRAR